MGGGGKSRNTTSKKRVVGGGCKGEGVVSVKEARARSLNRVSGLVF